MRRLTIDNNISITFDPFGFSVNDFQTRMPLMRCDSIGDLYPITDNYSVSHPSTFAAHTSSLWHNRLGHPGSSILRSLSKNKFIGCNNLISKFVCDSCVFGKHIKFPFYASQSHTLVPFDIMHNDLWTSPILSTVGHKYYVLFCDDYSNFLWTFPISKKFEVYYMFSSLTSLIKTQFDKTIKYFQCDNGHEFDNESFRKCCDANGLIFRFSCPHTSSQNGKVERKICTINNMIRTLLVHSSMPTSFWHHALQMATYLLNILPHKSLNHKSPT